MHVRRADAYVGPDPHVRLTFLTDDWEGMLVCEVRYKGPGLHVTLVRAACPMLMQGGDKTEFDRAISKAYNDLVEGRMRQ